MLTRLGERVATQLASTNPWGTSYALARTLLALSTLSTLMASPTHALFLPSVGRPEFPYCSDVAGFGIFCIASDLFGSSTILGIFRVLAIVSLFLAASGLWPRYLGPVQWWITFSFQANAAMVDGGDQIAAIFDLLLLPCCLTDSRWNHWAPMTTDKMPGLHVKLWGWMSHLTVRYQISIIYFHACVGKFHVQEWLDGTALYYWTFDPQFGATGMVRSVLGAIVKTRAVAWLTWSVLALELALAIAGVLTVRQRRILFWPAVLFHVAIAVIHGLLSFSLAMWGGLVIYAAVTPSRAGLSRFGQKILCVTRRFGLHPSMDLH